MKNRYSAIYLVPLLAAAMPGMAAETTDLDELRRQIGVLEQRLDAIAAVERDTAPARTTLGGYGELHYNNWENQKSGGSDKREIDFHRFVLFISHQFDSKTRLFSELELEHAFSKDTDLGTNKGEVELEQAYVEFDLSESSTARGGLFLLPIGLLNETHEPPTFYGVERNNVESNIIPSTWWEGGAGFSQRFANGLSWDLALHSGLNAPNYDIRKGRQKVSSAKGNALAYTARIKWSGVPGLEVAASLNHQNDITQGSGAKISGNLLESHIAYSSGPFALKALVAGWRLDDNGSANGMERQQGSYIEPSYKLSEKVGLFVRHSRWDNAAGDSSASLYRQNDIGINYWPHPDVVIKADYQNQSAPSGKDEYDGFNLGIGFQF